MPIDFNQQIIDEFRANQGRVGGPFEGARLLLLTTVGAKTGARRTTPLGYLPDGDRILIIASAGGAPAHPAWYHNLRANPQVTVEDGVFTYQAKAVVLESEERDRMFARAVEADPGWAAYETMSGRVLPVVALIPIDGGPPTGPMGDALRRLHDAFRRELAIIRGEVAASGPRLGAQLRVNCLTLCQGLHVHHEREDGFMFPALEGRHPELAAALERLRAEHAVVQELLERLQELLAADDVSPEALSSEVNRLTAELEAHLDYEEEQLVPLLNGA
ncbi:nitroreductase family deazaflavin-dependent oxidoreductase [Nonomuraea turkmeniaca]|uniref:Nitroreductase family deazaflavin-dependent oxidoreductase n=1 Tax=Nonomuraea turkmeniaca TaxID=103838 RepID=A0A5S4FHA9_9ACTN|nr:nitroreductase/quinone reductase family protein [Nonomuraea turkmeniaca]TMR08384.1 nitroreductase family deazaflavin-dependent oxidoreductase [Nonomuraea turkmeniaca]